MRPRPAHMAALPLLGLLILAAPCLASDGLLGIYFDRNGNACSGDVPTAGFTTMYVVFQPSGSSFGGITGAEFRIDTSGAAGFIFQNGTPEAFSAVTLGDPLGGGANIAASSCRTGTVVVANIQALNTGSGRDGVVRIAPKNPPTNPTITCTLVTLCENSSYSSICVDPGGARLNSTSPTPCSGRVDSEWTRVKELFR